MTVREACVVTGVKQQLRMYTAYCTLRLGLMEQTSSLIMVTELWLFAGGTVVN